jgi:hypothetical protein
LRWPACARWRRSSRSTTATFTGVDPRVSVELGAQLGLLVAIASLTPPSMVVMQRDATTPLHNVAEPELAGIP